MQREDPEGIVIVCDFCRRDWDGAEAMIEGHHGSILCLACMKKALDGQHTGGEKYKCTLCLRFNIAPEMPRWSNPEHPEAVVCQECLYQAARTFSRNEEVEWTFDPAQYPAAIKSPKALKPAAANKTRRYDLAVSVPGHFPFKSCPLWSALVNPVIRPAVVADVPAILGLIRELAEYEKLSHACAATEDLLKKHLFGKEADRAADSLVATLDGAVVGYAIFFKSFSTFLTLPGIYLEDIYVQPAHRRRGIGKMMLKELARLAIARGYGRVEWCVLDWNTPSIEFYKSLGAFPLDEWTIFRLTGEALGEFARK